MKSNVVPFGKYKGKPIEVLVQDPEYCDWLCAQPGFRERFAGVYNLIINNFGEPTDTPVHNRLQALFTDAAWVKAFVRAYNAQNQVWPNWIKNQLEQLDAAVKAIDAGLESFLASWSKWNSSVRYDESYEPDRVRSLVQDRINDCERRKLEYKELRHHCACRVEWLNSGFVPQFRVVKIDYEVFGRDVDIDMEWYVENTPEEAVFKVGYGFSCNDKTWEFDPFYGRALSLNVEIKPTLGDDFPTVLRQMKVQGSNVLLLGNGGYQGEDVTYEQVETMFRASKRTIVRIEDVNKFLEQK